MRVWFFACVRREVRPERMDECGRALLERRGLPKVLISQSMDGKIGGAWRPVMRVWLFACVRRALRAQRADEGAARCLGGAWLILL